MEEKEINLNPEIIDVQEPDKQVENEVETRAIDGVKEPEKTIVEEEKPVENEVDEDEKHIIQGYAIVFNSFSENMGGFVERILPEAVNQNLINKSDIYFLYNHLDSFIPLARSKYGEGSLKLTIDEVGLHYEFECLNDEFFNAIKRKDLDLASFAFTLPTDEVGYRWIKSPVFNYIKDVYKLERLYDLSTVTIPAYNAASTSTRKINNSDVKIFNYSEFENKINELQK